MEQDPYAPPASSLTPRVGSLEHLGSLDAYRFPFRVRRAGFFRPRLEVSDAGGRLVASIRVAMGFLHHPFDLEWEDETRFRFQERRSFFALFHPYELLADEQVLARYAPASAGCWVLLKSSDWRGESPGASVLIRKRWFALAQAEWPAQRAGERLRGRVDHEALAHPGAPPLLVERGDLIGSGHTIYRLETPASPLEERLGLCGILLCLATRALRSPLRR